VKKHWLAVVLLFLVATAWGMTFTLVKSVLTRIAPEPFIVFRFTLAGVVLLIAAFAMRSMTRDALKPGAILGIAIFVAYWCQTRGLLTISPSRSAFLTGVYVVMVPFADWLVYRARVPLSAWCSSIVALAGTAFLIGGFNARPQLGDLLTLICAAASALHVVLSAKYSAETSPLALAAIQVLVVAAGATPLSFFAHRVTLARDVVWVIAFTAIVTTALAFVALMWGQARVTATEAAVILAFEPVAASITNVLVDHEPITTTFVIGALLILAAMVLSQLPESPKRDPLAS
jgi:drug/metabolite transporter (DMT)-like permease